MKRLIVLLLLVLLFFGISKAVKKDFVIYIDPGHGGYDGGATYDNINENMIVLPVAKKLESYLKQLDVEVRMTRTEDIALADKKVDDIYKRIELMQDADLFISIHANAYTDELYYGAQTFYSDNNDLNKSISTSIQSILKLSTDTSRESKEVAGICLLDRLQNPGCLVELGFLSNSDERKKLIDPNYQDSLAYSIYFGVLDYMNNNNLIN